MCQRCDEFLIDMLLDKAWQDGTLREVLCAFHYHFYSEGFADGEDARRHAALAAWERTHADAWTAPAAADDHPG